MKSIRAKKQQTHRQLGMIGLGRMGGNRVHRFYYRKSFDAPSPDAYETLLWDVMKRDATLFMRADQVEAAWQLLQPVLEAWSATQPSDFPNYPAGSWGPDAVQGLLARQEHRWLEPTVLVKPASMKEKKPRSRSR